MIDTTNKQIRYVMTDRGRGTLIGYDDKNNPWEACVKFEAGSCQCYSVEKCFEMEKE